MAFEHILLVDDDKATNFYHKLLFKRLGLPCHTSLATDGKEAFIYCSKQSKKEKQKLPDLILLDLNMAGFDGFEFLDCFTTLDHKFIKDTTIFVLTTSESKKDMERIKKYSIVKNVIKKPIKEEQLKKIVLADM